MNSCFSLILFQPDIGQGVNAAFEDIVALDKALLGSSVKGRPLATSLSEYGNERKQEVLQNFALIIFHVV